MEGGALNHDNTIMMQKFTVGKCGQLFVVEFLDEGIEPNGP